MAVCDKFRVRTHGLPVVVCSVRETTWHMRHVSRSLIGWGRWVQWQVARGWVCMRGRCPPVSSVGCRRDRPGAEMALVEEGHRTAWVSPYACECAPGCVALPDDRSRSNESNANREARRDADSAEQTRFQGWSWA